MKKRKKRRRKGLQEDEEEGEEKGGLGGEDPTGPGPVPAVAQSCCTPSLAAERKEVETEQERWLKGTADLNSRKQVAQQQKDTN